DVLVDTLLLMKKSLQKGILKLRDKADNTQRATTRVEILHGLLQKKYTVSDAFIKSLERRIVRFLSEQEKIKGKENWVVAQALSDLFVAEGSSFRHVLWVHLEDSVASALAHILAVIDGDNNLENLIKDQPSEKTDFWLRVFQEDQWDLLKIPSFSETLTRLTPRLYHDLTGNDPDGVPLPWLYAVNKYMHDNHQLLYSLSLQNTDVATAGEATEALKQVLQGLQPKESELKDLSSCQQWLKKVKSVSVAVDLILSDDSLVTLRGENAEMLLSEIRVVCGYCDKDFTEDDTAEVECGHMFHLSCLRGHSDTQCRTCRKPITRDYKPCGVVAKGTFLKVNRFRRKCNSFFVEFMWNFSSSKEQLTDKVLNNLMDYVRCSPAPEASSGRSTLQQYMKPDPAVQSLILKILLKCGMEETAPQLQRFIEEAVKSNERNADEIYFMVVRSIEDHIHFSSQGCLINKAIKCLSTCVFSESDQNMISEDLHTIAKLRFAITVASDAIRTVLSKVEADDSRHLLRNLEEFLSNTGNPWIQIFLLRNICETHGSSFIYQLGQSEKLWWTIPSHVLKEQQDMSKQTVDQFQMYGEMYKKITLDSFIALEEPSHEIAQEFDNSSPCFYVCMALAAVRQAAQNKASTNNSGSL
ncbi:E3 ubiquitin-protein ligase, partial [Clarias magur]